MPVVFERVTTVLAVYEGDRCLGQKVRTWSGLDPANPLLCADHGDHHRGGEAEC